MRDFKFIDFYLSKLSKDIYAQPEDEGHSGLAYKAIDFWMSRMTSCKSVLDVGCGTGFCGEMFKVWGVEYEGVCLGEDYIEAKRLGRNVKKMDYHFLEYEDNSFDLIFSRHSWEHSPMPLIALMEWERVSKYWLGLILPAPEWYGFKGRNHYSVQNQAQVEQLVDCSGWKIMWDNIDYLPKKDNISEENPEGLTPHEYWYMLEKKNI